MKRARPDRRSDRPPTARPSGRQLRVCHVTTTHIRHDPRVFLKECVSLAQAGHDVHLVIGDGHGPEQRDGVTIHDMGPRPGSRLGRMWGRARLAGETVAALRPDVVHVHDPELLPIALRCARRGVTTLFDSHEDFPGAIQSRRWIPRPLRRGVSMVYAAYQRRVVRQLSGVVAATPHIAGRFAWLGDRVVCVNNYPFPDEMPPAAEGPRRRQVCYIGGVSTARGALVVVQALALVPDARLVICGPFFEPTLETALRAEPGWAQVEYLGAVDRPTVARVLAESAVGVVTYLPEPNHLEAQPTKLFEYMAAALPVVASDFPHWRQVVAANGAGLCVDPESPEQVALAIRTLLDRPAEARSMGRAGRAAVMAQYNWPVEAGRLAAFYERLTRSIVRT